MFSDIVGRGVFTNAGDTPRQGVEASVSYKTGRWFTYANYAFSCSYLCMHPRLRRRQADG